jgi:surface protein
MPNFSTLNERYPIVFASPISDVEDLNTNQFTLEIYCVDIIQKDRANLNTIVSDCHLILKDLFIYYRDDNDVDLDVVGTASISFVNNFDLDYVAGAVMTITFEVAGYGSCEIPMLPITPTHNDCEPATLIVRDSDDNVLYTLTVDSGATETQVIADSTYLVEYENGTPIESGSILAGGSAVIQVPNPITCADATVENSDASYTDTVASGGTLVLPDVTITAYNSDLDVVVAVTGASVRDVNLIIDDSLVSNSNSSYSVSLPASDPLVLPDITVTDSDGSTYTQPSVEDVVCTLSPDTSLEVNGTPEGTFAAGSTIEVNITDGVNPVTPDNVTVVGDVVTIEVPSGGGGSTWVRPSDWLTMPTVTSAQDTFVGLHAVFSSGNNFAAFRFTTSTGQYQVDWGDGVVDLVNSNVIAEHTYDYNTYDPTNATLSTRGYKQAIITVTPVTGNLLSCNFQFRRTTVPAQNQGYATGFLDCILSMPNINVSNGILFGGGTVRHSYCEQFEIKNSGGCLSLNDTFFNCFSLKSIPFLDTVGITSMNQMFLNCSSLQTVALFDTSSVTNMGSMFGNCTSLQSVPLFDTSSATTMVGIFSGCSSLLSVPLFNTSNVTTMGSMFSLCSSLQSVPLFNTSNVTNMSSMFNACRSINEIPAFNTTLVTSQGDNFTGCFSLDKTNIICRVSVNFSNCQLSQAELVNIFNNLLDRTLLTPANINITGNWGATALTVGERAIAIGKNWTITG